MLRRSSRRRAFVVATAFVALIAAAFASTSVWPSTASPSSDGGSPSNPEQPQLRRQRGRGGGARDRRAPGWCSGGALSAAFASTSLLLSAASPSSAATTQTTFTVNADSYATHSRPTANYGSASMMQVQATKARAYIAFNVSGLVGTVSAATLRLSSSTTNPQGITVAHSATGWSESTITWKNAPAPGATIGSSGPITAPGWVNVDVAVAVTGNGSYAFALTSSSATLQSLATKEGGNGAQLVITTTVPTTTTTAPPTTSCIPSTPVG